MVFAGADLHKHRSKDMDMDTTTAAAPFTVGQRVARRYDSKPGTVESVQPYGTHWGIAVKLDADGGVWSGTEVAWRALDGDCDACHARPAGHGHFGLYCEPCSELPYGVAAPVDGSN